MLKGLPPVSSQEIVYLSGDELLEFLKKYKLVSEKATAVKPYFYSGVYVDAPTPCTVVGYYTANEDSCILAIDVCGVIFGVHCDYFKEMQTKKKRVPAEQGS